MIRKTLIVSLLLLATTSLTSCATYSSRTYTPGSKADQVIFNNARKDIYPQQVRRNPVKYGDETIAWAGIVKDVELFQSRYGLSARILIEHRYFDWIEDHGAQAEVFFLSPRGEGDFMIFVKPDDQLSRKEAQQLVPVGTMVVAIGKIHVKTAQDKSIPLSLMTDYHQFIDRKWYRSDVFDYGREGEPIKKVQGGEYWEMRDSK